MPELNQPVNYKYALVTVNVDKNEKEARQWLELEHGKFELLSAGCNLGQIEDQVNNWKSVDRKRLLIIKYDDKQKWYWKVDAAYGLSRGGAGIVAKNYTNKDAALYIPINTQGSFEMMDSSASGRVRILRSRIGLESFRVSRVRDPRENSWPEKEMTMPVLQSEGKVAQRLVILNYKMPEVKNLRAAIGELKKYSSNSIKRSITLQNAADVLNVKLNNFVSRSDHSPAAFNRLKQDFTQELKKLSSLNLSEHRNFKKVVIANILIGLTGIGAVILAGKAIHSRVTTGKAQGFFAKTDSQQRVDKVKEELDKIEPPSPK